MIYNFLPSFSSTGCPLETTLENFRFSIASSGLVFIVADMLPGEREEVPLDTPSWYSGREWRWRAVVPRKSKLIWLCRWPLSPTLAWLPPLDSNLNKLLGTLNDNPQSNALSKYELMVEPLADRLPTEDPFSIPDPCPPRGSAPGIYDEVNASTSSTRNYNAKNEE